jgi:hypothetical protein
MHLEGRCYCGAVRYAAEGEPGAKAQCHCRECQYITGGSPNLVIGMPEEGFSYTAGTPRQFRREDLETPVTREFCPRCGTHLVAKTPALPGAVLIRVGTLNEPQMFERPEIAIHTADRQSFHHIPDGIAAFERLPA